ncbi:FxsB family cyclophane-forming radical SAM/SPASM peptide maturase [Actinosynnema sp. NPDC020468]|uniref:FxsB family cyclophane-forming radical SAM/SPASM peptide maturase n=1 Tax=Actinosynnema sp. NPDC020468 TaxID=3154488 RepID=UPI0033CE5FA9
MKVLPFRQFILKVHGRCNLACDYCYVYTRADQRWRSRPRVMSAAVAERAVERIAEHVRAHDLPRVDVVLHGGEPLLAGVAFLEELVRGLRSRVPVPVDVVVQTNGTLLDRGWLEVLARLRVRVGVSVDGVPEAHDRHRVRPDGRGSWASVAAGLRLLADEFPEIYGGVLCVVDPAVDAVATYEFLVGLGAPVIDFLLPHGDWCSPPAGMGVGGTPYAEWLIAVFDRWYSDPRCAVRVFEEILALVLGGRSRVEGWGNTPPAHVVVEVDGDIEVSDIVASGSPEASATGLNVGRDSFDDALRVPGVAAARGGPCAECLACPVVAVCGGGLRAHRLHPDGTFDHPSVYCPDLYRLVGHVRDRVAGDLARLR